MMSYRFEKWYFDALTDCGDFVLLYIVHIRFAGLSQWSITVSVAPGDGAAAQTASLSGNWKNDADDSDLALDTRFGNVRLGNAAGRISLCIQGIGVKLEYNFGATGVHFLPAIVVPCSGGRRISWAPIPESALVNGEISMTRRKVAINAAHGYADYVFSNVFPRAVPVRTVLWGRLHHPDLFLTYSLLTGESSSQRWGGVVAHTKETTAVLQKPSLRVQQTAGSTVIGRSCPSIYELFAESDDCRIALHARHVRPAVAARFVKDQRLVGCIADSFYRWISRNPRGEKYVAQASATISVPGRELILVQATCIDEYVVFSNGWRP
jgi:hypothetical protein